MTEHSLPFSPDDPRLSAYLLGEMSAAEKSAFESELEAHPEARTLLEELGETSSLLKSALEQEPAPALSAAQRSQILSAAATAPSPVSKENPIMKRSHRLTTWGIIAAVSALSVAVAVWLNSGGGPKPNAEPVATQYGPLDAEKTPSAEPNSRFWNDQAKKNHGYAQTSGRVRSAQIGKELSELNEELATRSETAAAKDGQIELGQKEKMGDQKLVGASIPGLRPDLAETLPPISSPEPGRPGEAAELESLARANRDKQKTPPGQSVTLARSAAEVRGREAGLAALDKNVKWRSDFEDEADVGGFGNESYQPIFENDFILPRGEQALSTFSIDVDTASYSNIRRFIKHGQRPPADAVRIEELVNYFQYDYAPPANGDPFSVHTEVAACPWKPAHRLVRIGLKGREISKEQRPLSNLVFLVDVSGSMSSANKLPLVKTALTMLASEMNENDRISLVTYAGTAAVKLPSTSGESKSDIISAIQSLSAGGSTNGEGGIQLAYTEAIRNFIEDGSNRVILCTDGDFNVGISDDDQLVTLIQEKAKNSGVFLSVFGFGMGNIKDDKLEKLADKGNGHYAYIDDQREARKVFVEELTGTLYTIAKDVKIQVEFNPAHVGAYRLIGYENRILAAQDFNDDTKDAGEIGAGHTVTALYEVIPIDKMAAVAEGVDNLKYQPAPQTDVKPSPDMLTLKLRFKKPDEDVSVKREYPVQDPGKKAAEPSRDTEWQSAVAAFGMVLRNSKHKGDADLRLVRELAMGSRGPDPTGRRREFIDLVLTAEKLATGQPLQPAQIPEQLPADEAQKAASVKGKYQQLLKTLSAPEDLGVYGAFNDYGYWEGQIYGDNQDLPKAHWVYVYPNWYLWGETATEKTEEKTEEKAE